MPSTTPPVAPLSPPLASPPSTPLRIAIALLAFVAVYDAPGQARADDGLHLVKRRAALASGAKRERVGTSFLETPKPTSVGSPSAGHLEGGVHLDTSRPYVGVVPAYARGDVRWGLPALTHMLERAARTVAKRYPGSVMRVGDLSRRGGGDVMRHHSHESGRDADVAFFIDDARGRPITTTPTFVRFDAALRPTNHPGARFDEAKNWLFVQTLLSDPTAHVSHIFIAAPLRQRLLAYGRAHGASHAIWERAAFTLMQPTDSEAHDDHMHVRVSCPSTSKAACVETAHRAAVHHPTTTRVAHRAVLRTPHVASASSQPGFAARPSPPPRPRAAPAPATPALSSPAPELDPRADLGPLERARMLR